MGHPLFSFVFGEQNSNYLKIETVCEKVFALTRKNAIMKQNSCFFKFFG